MRFLNHLIKRRLLALYLCPIASILSAKEIDDLPTVDTSLSLWGLIQQGGWAMYPLGICSLITFSSLPMHGARRVPNASSIGN